MGVVANRVVSTNAKQEQKKVDESLILSSQELQKISEQWKSEGWPVNYLQRNHFRAKVLHDNAILAKAKFYGHNFKIHDNEVYILFRRANEEHSTWTAWSEILSKFPVKATKSGELLFPPEVVYGEEGLEHISAPPSSMGYPPTNKSLEARNFIFPPAEFNWHLEKWIKEGWPLQFLLRDHYGARVLFDNQVFQFMEVFGHGWKWDDKEGLILLYKRTVDSPSVWTPWKDIADDIPIQRTSQGWLIFDGWTYTLEGLAPIHLWQWKNLRPNYIYPPEHRPDYCYVDIITCCWEHRGMPGLGIDGTSQGHITIEFCDDLGNLYSVGMYMDPRSPLDTKRAPAATVKACLFSPDHYFPSRGEKAVNRYSVGRGKEGRTNINKLKKYIEDIQNYTVSSDGKVITCPRKYQAITDNCGQFVLQVERFVVEELKGTLVKITKRDVFPPGRDIAAVSSIGQIQHWKIWFWNTMVLLFVDILMFILIMTPLLRRKMGVGLEDDFSDFNSIPKKSQNELPKASYLGLRRLKNKIERHRIWTPRRAKLYQLYNKARKDYTILLNSVTPSPSFVVRNREVYSPKITKKSMVAS